MMENSTKITDEFLSDSDLSILIKSQEDVKNLLSEVREKSREISRLKSLIEESKPTRYSFVPEFILLTLGGFLLGFLIGGALVSRYSYQSGIDEGWSYKRQLCQLKHPKSVGAYQSCLDS